MRVSAYLLDAGPLAALMNRRDQYHEWARQTLDTLDGPLLTCEAVLSEAWFLARRGGADPVRLLELVHALGVEVVPAWSPRMQELLRRYAERASVADAALLTLAEAEAGRVVVTTDREDFRMYRIHRRQAVPAVMPPAGETSIPPRVSFRPLSTGSAALRGVVEREFGETEGARKGRLVAARSTSHDRPDAASSAPPALPDPTC